MAEGLTKSPDEIYCPECGRTIQRDSAKCSFCDTDLLSGLEIQQALSHQLPSGQGTGDNRKKIHVYIPGAGGRHNLQLWSFGKDLSLW